MKARYEIIPALFLAGGLVGSVLSWSGCASHKSQQAHREDLRMSESEVSAQVDKALPAWDRDVLSVRDGAKWSAEVGFEHVLSAMGDSALRDEVPTGARRVVDGRRVLRVNPERGEFRYVNRTRAWKPDSDSKLIEEQAALQVASKTLAGLGLPRAELGKLRVDTQGGRDASNSSPGDFRTYEMYRLVTMTRQMGSLPVLGSRARVAVAGSGGIQRLRVKWPPFTMPDGLRLRQRDAVAKQVVDLIMRQDPVPLTRVAGSDLTRFVSAKLAYAPQEMTRPHRSKPPGDDSERLQEQTGPPDADDDRKDGPVQFESVREGYSPILFVPVVLVTVAAGPTPYQLVVPVAEAR